MIQITEFDNFNKANTTDISTLLYPLLATIKDDSMIAVKETYGNYFFIECTGSSNTCTFIPKNGNKLYYSRNGLFWDEFDNVTINRNERIYLRGSNMISNGEEQGIGQIYMGYNGVNIGGNIMSLLFGDDDFDNIFDISEYDYAFYKLFENETILKIYEGLLPATELSEYCYYEMFSKCRHINDIPRNLLPALKVKKGSYKNMFSNSCQIYCPNTVMPDLPATELSEECYYGMYAGSYILYAPESLPAKHLPKYCYAHMFDGCQRLLTGVKDIQAETVSYGSCINMFEEAYNMTECCTTFNIKDSLPAYCFQYMYSNCKKLIAEPYLNITSIGEHSISGMFDDCYKLTGITMLATTRYSNYRNDWLPYLNAPFYKHPQVKTESNLNTVLAEKVPSKWYWEIQPVGTILAVRNLTITPKISSIVATDTTAIICYKYLCDVEYEGVTYTNVECYGPGISEEFQPNETSDAIEKTISFTYKGMTATTIITHNGVA